MKFIRGLHNLTCLPSGCVLTIGNFDGVHSGHHTLLTRLRQVGDQRGLPVAVMIFEPQPLEFFASSHAPARLTKLREKIAQLVARSVDAVICVNFNAEFAKQSAETFIQKILLDKLQVKFLVVGDDFRFGAGRRGDFALLNALGAVKGLAVVSAKTFCDNGNRVSSTAIRVALAASDFAMAERLLARPYSLSGLVVHGEALGRQLGFQTANILLQRQVLPVKGVFAVNVKGVGESAIHGVANIGTRPTVKGKRQQLEVHLFDVNLNLYGCYIEVVLQHKIRDEQRFASLNELQAQIAQDVVTARAYFGLHTTV